MGPMQYTGVSEPLYRQLAAKLRREIREHHTQGARLPTDADLCTQNGVSRITVRRAMEILVQEGLVERRRGRGTFVKPSRFVSSAERVIHRVATNLALEMSSSEYIQKILLGATEFFEHHGMHLVIKQHVASRGPLEELLPRLVEERMHGFLCHCIGGENKPAIIAAAASLSLPTVFVNTRENDPSVDYVTCDNILGGTMAADYLLELGHRRVAFYCPAGMRFPYDVSSVDRWTGFTNRILTSGGEALCFAPWNTEQECSVEALIGSLSKFTAVFCVNDSVAALLIRRLVGAGIRVPEEVSVIGYDNNVGVCEHASVPITTLAQPAREIGARAAQFLWERITGQELSGPRHLEMPPKLIVRASVARPHAAASSRIHVTTGETAAAS